MIARLDHLRQHPGVFRSLTGISAPVFDQLAADVLPALADADHVRRDRPGRRRAVGAGHPFGLGPSDQVLLAVAWLRVYPTHAVPGYLFGVSQSAARRTLGRVLPVLARAGKDTMRMPDPGKHARRDLPAVLRDTPGLAVLVDTFEQPTRRPKRRQRAYYSGKKKRHTLKSQVAVDEGSGRVVHVPPSVPGPTADLKALARSRLLGQLPEGVGLIGDTAYLGAANLRAGVARATPRRKPRGKPRPSADRRYSRAVSRRRVVAEHTIGRLRVFQALAQVNRHGRKEHEQRVRAVAGLVNRMIDARATA
jgi:DDE superfamily endonuclease/Helix-turn-helix of DDE superfamily endonuclease